jgi:hypothetical protein
MKKPLQKARFNWSSNLIHNTVKLSFNSSREEFPRQKGFACAENWSLS